MHRKSASRYHTMDARYKYLHFSDQAPASKTPRKNDVPVGAIGISSVVLAELWFGICASRDKKKNEAALNDLLLYTAVHAWPEEAAPIYARLHDRLRQT